MRFDLKRPCAQCPFRTDIDPYLRPARVTEIERALERGVFSCHKTVDYSKLNEDDEDDGPQQHIPEPDEQHCAGALILLEKLDRPSQMMRIMERIRGYDRRQLDMTAPVFDTFDAMRRAQSLKRKAKR